MKLVKKEEPMPYQEHGDLIDRDEMAHEIWCAHCYECKPDQIEKHCESCVVKDILDCIMDFPEYIPVSPGQTRRGYE